MAQHPQPLYLCGRRKRLPAYTRGRKLPHGIRAPSPRIGHEPRGRGDNLPLKAIALTELAELSGHLAGCDYGITLTGPPCRQKRPRPMQHSRMGRGCIADGALRKGKVILGIEQVNPAQSPIFLAIPAGMAARLT